MLNQFYKYLSEKLNLYMLENLKKGERFYFQIENQKELDSFYNFLSTLPNSEEFVYTHPQGTIYKSFCLNIGEKRLIVAATKEGVTSDFLVTLRNQVANSEEAEFMNSGMIFLITDFLESLSRGATNLKNKDMPFNITTLCLSLNEEIKNSKLKKAEKFILQNSLDKKIEDFYNSPSIWDLQDILAILIKEKIDFEQYAKIGIFPDNEIFNEKLKNSEIKERIEENRLYFEKVQSAVTYSLEEVSNLLDKKGLNLLKEKLENNEWEKIEFQEIIDSVKRLKEIKKENINFLNFKFSDDFLSKVEYLEKKEKENTTSYIFFNNNKHSFIPIELKFDKRIKNDLIKTDKNLANRIKISGNTIYVNLDYPSNKFAKLTYDYGKKYIIHIIVLDCKKEYFKSIETDYSVKVNNSNRADIFINLTEEGKFIGNKFGIEKNIEEYSENSLKSNCYINLDNIKLNLNCDEYDGDKFKTKIKFSENSEINLNLMTGGKKDFPWDGNKVFRAKFRNKKSFYYDFEKNKIIQGTETYTLINEFSKFLKIEKSILELSLLSGKINLNELNIIPRELDISNQLKESYLKIIEYYIENNLLPSLTYINSELKKLYLNFIELYNKEIEEIQEDIAIVNQNKKIDLSKIGVFQYQDKFYLSSLHPINIIYQIKLIESINESIPDNIFSKLKYTNLIPYMINEKELYRNLDEKSTPEWKKLGKVKDFTIGQSEEFVEKIIKSKLIDYYTHFNYLFPKGINVPLTIKFINIENDDEAIRGIISFMLWQLKERGLDNIIPLEIYINKSLIDSNTIEKISELNNFEELCKMFNLRLQMDNYDSMDLFRKVIDNIKFFTKQKDSIYSHISFYKISSNENFADEKISEIPSGVIMDGLISSLSSLTSKNDYRTGFGLKNLSIKGNILLKTAKNINELFSNINNNGNNLYRRGNTIVTTVPLENNEAIKKISNDSFWINFIEPNVNLDYFYKFNKDLIVIHYSDQYTSSSQYDSVTASSKISQYKLLIGKYLSEIEELKNSNFDKMTIADEVIKTFNSFNGEWLLRIIGSQRNPNLEKEKISIISAIKNLLVYLELPNFIWVPISLEEILRVAGSVGLNKDDGIFSARNLGSSGQHSDDLLMVGIENISGELKLHYYPVEVKIGINNSNIKKKAVNQLEHTIKLFRENLARDTDEIKNSFKNKYYRNFFVQIIISMVEKLSINKIYLSEEQINIFESLKNKLIDDEYEISYDLDKIIGEGGIVSFKKDTPYQQKITMDYKEKISTFEYKYSQAYKGIIESVNTIRDGYIYRGEKRLIDEIKKDSNYNSFNLKEERLDQTSSNIDIKKTDLTKEVKENISLDKIRVLIGEIDGTSEKIYWEYGNKHLANRHLLISGRSGQGKSYFIQCMLLELSRQGIPGLIIDYTDGFKRDQLDEIFVKEIGNKLDPILVVMKKIPINPFKRNKIEIDIGIEILESNIDVADRVSSIFKGVFRNLGDQQRNCIREAVKTGIEKYKEKMNLSLLVKELEEQENNQAKTVITKIAPLVERDPFNYSEEYDWDKILNSDGIITILQLTSLPRDLQLMITEFVLWDLWNYLSKFGNKNKPISIILDEAQNLDHSDKSPSAKILTEGRKFGFSGWYATQFINAQLENDEVMRLQNASQKIYFLPPENEIGTIAGNFSRDSYYKKEWEEKLKRLKKGQCIFHGPLLIDGELKNFDPQIVNITSLEKRRK
ncbi:MAG: hypothetical protein ACRCXT_14955 [Paraclostridium sp.]